MKSDLPKVVFEVGGRAMVCAVVDACRAAGVGRIIVVVGHRQELVREALKGFDVEYAVQDQQLGTGHAVLCAEKTFGTPAGDALVLCGDGPLIRAATVRTLVDRHRETHAAATLATAMIEDPTGYGRIVRDANGRFVAIVEHKNCTTEQLKVREVNPSYYCFAAPELFAALHEVKRNPLSGEYYITDVPELLLKAGKRVEVIEAVPPEDILSINTPEELARVDAIYRARAGGKAVHA
ncbi:UDP-N-acetylglucosamine pyrophosphorylase [Phycisphaerales bacterium]|nr:UDP-N-acetylglucosamine pyrophosphorylase [Phycisphaerales bacterium]